MTGKLFVISTPIGNLKDITLRALETLKAVDAIAAESIEHSLKLLNHYEIKKELVSYNDNNKEIKATELIDRFLKRGKDLALITDAGTPCVSDPGYLLVKKCREQNILVVAIPGVSAAITALSVSGFPSDEFSFVGFLPSSLKQKKESLSDIIDKNLTTIVYEAPHRLMETLELLHELAPVSTLLLARELTKMFEDVKVGTAFEIISHLKGNSALKDKLKGECTLIIAKSDVLQPAKEELERQVLDEANAMILKGMSTKDIAELLSHSLKYPKKKIYDLIVKTLKSH